METTTLYMKMNRSLKHLSLFLMIALLAGCEKDSSAPSFEPDFEFSMHPTENNVMVFKNITEGDHYFVRWIFGNGERTDRIPVSEGNNMSVYYPKRGQYNVEFTVWGSQSDLSNNKSITKTINIEEDDPDYVETDGLIWSDEFDGSSVDLNNWTFEEGTGDNGWGNNELQYYTKGDNAHLEDGKLIITAKKINDNKERGSYTSTRMISWGKKEFKYGRIEVRAKLPSGTGIWPAIWMLGTNLGSAGWPACGEIDIMEYVGYQPNVVHSTVHTTAGSGANGNGSSMTLPTCEEEFHIYGLVWTSTALTFYVDTPDNILHIYNPAIKTDENWPFNKAQFFILNVAVGGDWGGAQGIDNTIFPQTMEIDYVRVYELD